MSAELEFSFAVRPFKPGDLAACKSLYKDGLLGGKLAENDTAIDLDDIESVYMRTPGNHFWVADTSEKEVVGMIGVQNHEEGVGEIRRLRVREDLRRRGIGKKLVEAALQFCADHQYLKITLDTFIEREPAISLFQKFRFRHDRTKIVAGKELLFFYLDIYGRENGDGAPR